MNEAAAGDGMDPSVHTDFDVFLSYNREDKEAVETMAKLSIS